MRKELKIRPGFTPQEDVGRFRGSRQRAQDQSQSTIPGSNRPRPPPATAENPFASPSPASGSSKTKSQVKNEKRREKKRDTTASKAWDASDDESDDGDIGDAFKQESSGDGAGTPGATNDEKARAQKSDGKAWPIDDAGQGQISEETPDGGGPPEEPIPIESAVADREDGDEGETAILSPPPPGPAKDDPAAPTAQPPKSTEPEWRTASSRSKRPSKPHPIQGGRQGPIGLAHPPPIESSRPPPRQNPSRQRSNNKPQQGAGDKPQQPRPQRNASETKQDKEPRVRKEYKVRDSGLGSLADRVKNLVVSNQDSEQKKKEKPATTKPAEKATPAA